MNVLKFSGVISHVNVQQLNLHVTNHQENFNIKTPCQHHHFFKCCKCLEFRKERSLTCLSFRFYRSDTKKIIRKCTLCIKRFINTYNEAHFQKDDIHIYFTAELSKSVPNPRTYTHTNLLEKSF